MLGGGKFWSDCHFNDPQAMSDIIISDHHPQKNLNHVGQDFIVSLILFPAQIYTKHRV